MWRFTAVLALVFAAALIALRWPVTASGDAPSTPVATTGPKTLGVSSCAAAACHHANGERGSKGSEYSTWIAVDPHAKAYRTLFKPESKAMHAALARGYPEMAAEKGAHDSPLCLRCHAMGDNVPRSFKCTSATATTMLIAITIAAARVQTPTINSSGATTSPTYTP